MLGQTLLGWIDKQCRQATGQHDETFGGKSIILVGDPAQLPHVADKPLYHTKLRRNVKKLIHKKYTDYLHNLADSVEKEPKRFGNFYSTKTKTRKLPLAIKRNKDDINPATCTAHQRKANLLINDYFHSVYSHTSAEPPPPGSHPVVPIHELPSLAVSASEVKSNFNNLDASKSPGPDGITARLRKEVAPEISDSVTSIFNKSLTSGVFLEK